MLSKPSSISGALCSLFMLSTCSLLISTCSASTQHEFVPSNQHEHENPIPVALQNLCSGFPPLETPEQMNVLQWVLDASGEKALLYENSAAHQAVCWMFFKDPVRRRWSHKSSFLQRYALVTFYFATQGPSGEIDEGVVNTTNSNNTAPRNTGVINYSPQPWSASGKVVRQPWLSNQHECNWYGVKCNIWKSVTGLDLGFHRVEGLLPHELFLLPHLKELKLHGNEIEGVLPNKALNHWKNLQRLELQGNQLFGSIHTEIGQLASIQELDVFGNLLGGTLPKELAQCTNLQKIDFFANSFQGTVPKEYSQLSNLRELDIHDNELVGSIPSEICAMNLDVLVADCLGPEPKIQCDCCTSCCRGTQCVETDDIVKATVRDW